MVELAKKLHCYLADGRRRSLRDVPAELATPATRPLPGRRPGRVDRADD
ncbi:hypothetical protein DHODJN_13845 [Methylorubrum extorquens]